MTEPEQIDARERDLLCMVTAGSVDDGKSTLIGRLLLDLDVLPHDQLAAIEQTARRNGHSAPNLAHLTDGLRAERDQGITIDVGYRFFATPNRRFIVADVPGHEQYTRNMVTGASTAELALVLIDARKGMTHQSRRHIFLTRLLGTPSLVVAVNKMDMVDYSETAFAAIKTEMATFCATLGIGEVHFVPVSALKGDNIVHPGGAMPWYRGETILELLEGLDVTSRLGAGPLRMPVQMVSRPQSAEHPDFRGYMGRIESGSIRIGDIIRIQPSGLSSVVTDILAGKTNLPEASYPQSVTLCLADDIDVGRGDLIADAAEPAKVARQIDAMLCWLDDKPLDRGRDYLIKHGTALVRGRFTDLGGTIDIDSLAEAPIGPAPGQNDIFRATIKLQRPVAYDNYGDNRTTGAFVVIDETSNATVAAGMIGVDIP
ncbi:MAG: GTP-binding protein [Alphaproteobacteria bacterium]